VKDARSPDSEDFSDRTREEDARSPDSEDFSDRAREEDARSADSTSYIKYDHPPYPSGSPHDPSRYLLQILYVMGLHHLIIRVIEIPTGGKLSI
jgi:hypothetical protein